MPETQRLFIAIPVPGEIREAAARVQAILRETGADISCPAPAKLHFTLVFLGDTFPDVIPTLADRLDVVAATVASFPIQVSGLGFFGPRHTPRVVWAGVQHPPPALFDLQKSVLAIVRELEFTLNEMAFKPHLTLARIRSAHGLDRLTRAIDLHKGEPLGCFVVDGIELVRSHLDEPRARYTVLHRSLMKGN